MAEFEADLAALGQVGGSDPQRRVSMMIDYEGAEDDELADLPEACVNGRIYPHPLLSTMQHFGEVHF